MVLQDTSFQGYAVAGAQTYQPREKAPWAGVALLTRLAINKVISRVRVGVENTPSAGSNAAASSPTPFATCVLGFVDAAIKVAYGLHNLRVAARA